MNRRQALRSIGLGAGAIVIGPTTLSLLQSCKNDPEYDWTPEFLSASHGMVLKNILEVMIPTTDTPGANDVNVAQFIDAYMLKVASPQQQADFKNAANAFAQAFENFIEKKTDDGESADFERIVERFLRATPAEKENFAKRTGETQDPMDKAPETDQDGEKVFSDEEADALAFGYLKNVRDMGIWAWKTSEEIGENVLWYDPVPGEYIACTPLEELGNGKAMSL
ncbi:gluconate 2-dehydrogenase subunit 3 family protein [Gramella sp. KN1008]|uniref:gluconate 2-dehydrogenase subunit 3 family protein n=1 Tax=Gramella sp. KN1008 TaxID=2529298 RepID=UPI00103C9EE9|nr:gluconate 2-dehydrogenase subunit 3 family protein [Gramella sp. KN1008]TBW27380.1 gluconate 2-dehydrogenase subunit 3 family protein [Gramella sp. KN1008]